jgi:acyl-CoA thioester hydrolase
MTKLSSASLQPLPVTQRAVIPESYLDLMGHMNVMWYVHLFSNAMWNMFERIGIDDSYRAGHHAGVFAIEQHMRYFKEVRVGNHVTVRSRLLGRSAKRLHVIHFMTIDEDDDALAAVGEFVATHVDMKERRSAPFPPSITEAIDRLLAEHSQFEWDPPVCGAMKA